MQKKRAHISLKLKKQDHVSVKKGDKISKGDVILTEKNAKLSEFNLSKLLGVPPKDVHKYLVIEENKIVAAGDVIAKKDGLFGKKLIKTPIAGNFIWVDKDTGLVGIHEEQAGEVVKAYFDGLVEDISETEIIFSVSGLLISAKDGKGSPVTGKLISLSPGTEAITMPTDIASSILAIKDAASELIAKADALGALGVIAESLDPPQFSLPFLQVQDIKTFSSYHGSTVILYGDKKELLIVEEK